MADLALNCTDVYKSFGTIAALAGAAFTVRSGTVHALVGENGAGKSTLIHVLSGMLRPTRGQLAIFGQHADFQSPLDAAAAGIGVVHQHFLLADALTVAENIALGQRTSPAGWRFDRRATEAAVAKLAAESGLHIDPAARVGDLPVGLRQRVEILKSLARGARLLLLDEPTAVLAPPEVETLFATLRKLRDAGRTLVIVTHKLDEVFALASDVTVLRKGQTVFSGPLSGLTPARLAETMIGHAAPQTAIPPRTASRDDATPILKMTSIRAGNGAVRIDALEVRAGEIVGVAGVEGNGQDALAAVLAGTIAPDPGTGRLELKGLDILPLSVAERSAAGLAHIPADRHDEGLILDMTLAENLVLRDPPIHRVAGVAMLDATRIAAESTTKLTEYGAVPPDPTLPARALSGGNQQKVVLARELSRNPSFILAVNPTRGLDVGASAEVYRRLQDAARRQQAAVLLISSDLDEVLLLADRVMVLYRGSLSEVGPRGVSRDAVGRAMTGA